jgi:hypothetical protein
MEAAGIAPASRNTQAIMQQEGCVDTPPPCLHIACTDFGLRELVACWHTLAADVRERILMIARGEEAFSLPGEERYGDARRPQPWGNAPGVVS